MGQIEIPTSSKHALEALKISGFTEITQGEGQGKTVWVRNPMTNMAAVVHLGKNRMCRFFGVALCNAKQVPQAKLIVEDEDWATRIEKSLLFEILNPTPRPVDFYLC